METPLNNKKQVDKAFRENIVLFGLVIKVDDRGLILDISGVECYMHISEIDDKYIHPKKLKSYLGERLEAKIIRFNRNGKNIKVSRKVLLNE